MSGGIRELAAACGVSVATVSRALNGHPEVSEATRRQVRETADRLGYRPSQSARALVRGRSDTVGVLWDTGYETTGLRHPFLQSVLVGVKRALSEAGRHMMLLNFDDRGSGERAYLDAARQHQLDGVVLMGVDDSHPSVRLMYDSGFPCVAFDLPIAGPRASYVSSDNRAGAMAAVTHLHGLGHRRVATITGPDRLLPAADRLAGYQAAVEALGMVQSPQYIVAGDFFLESGYAAARQLVGLADRPTAIFAAGDEMAIGAMHALEDCGIKVPQQVAVVGFDDIEAAGLVRPSLTTIAQDPVALGRAAVDSLLGMVGAGSPDGPQPAAPRSVATRLIVRGSCGGG
jgi:LacI family transcriptional regulator